MSMYTMLRICAWFAMCSLQVVARWNAVIKDRTRSINSYCDK